MRKFYSVISDKDITVYFYLGCEEVLLYFEKQVNDGKYILVSNLDGDIKFNTNFSESDILYLKNYIFRNREELSDYLSDKERKIHIDNFMKYKEIELAKSDAFVLYIIGYATRDIVTQELTVGARFGKEVVVFNLLGEIIIGNCDFNIEVIIKEWILTNKENIMKMWNLLKGSLIELIVAQECDGQESLAITV